MNLKTTIKTTIEKLSRISETSYPALKWKEKFLSQIKIHTGVHLTVLTIATLNLTKLRVLKTNQRPERPQMRRADIFFFYIE